MKKRIAGAIYPPLKWPGGKRWLIPHLVPIWRHHRDKRLVEPFCGGLAVSLGLMPRKALLNDINSHVINFYKWLQKGLTVEENFKNNRAFYYKRREEFNSLIMNGLEHTKRAAELFYYLNRTGYNGLCRFNNSGQFNVPFGKYKSIHYTKDFSQYKLVFSKWTFIYGDFQRINLQPDDFIYADPPYDVEFTKYSKQDFKWDDQERLAVWLSKHKGIVVLSNQATNRIISLYKTLGFTLRFLSAPRRISCNGDRMPTIELLATRGI